MRTITLESILPNFKGLDQIFARVQGDFQALILEAGRIPAERNTVYTRINLKLPAEALTAEQLLEPEFA